MPLSCCWKTSCKNQSSVDKTYVPEAKEPDADFERRAPQSAWHDTTEITQTKQPEPKRSSFDQIDPTTKRASLPKRIILIRHGHSEGNANEAVYSQTPDWKVPLSDKGRKQAYQAGLAIREKVLLHENVYFIVSPYLRTTQTFEEIKKHFKPHEIRGTREEPRIREQDFGNFQDPAGMVEIKKERNRFGRFFYRFPNGESGADVYDRIDAFTGSLIRSFKHFDAATTVVIVTHGIALRVFLMRWFHWSVETFEQIWNPGNCDMCTLMFGPRGYVLDPSASKVLGIDYDKLIDPCESAINFADGCQPVDTHLDDVPHSAELSSPSTIQSLSASKKTQISSSETADFHALTQASREQRLCKVFETYSIPGMGVDINDFYQNLLRTNDNIVTRKKVKEALVQYVQVDLGVNPRNSEGSQVTANAQCILNLKEFIRVIHKLEEATGCLEDEILDLWPGTSESDSPRLTEARSSIFTRSETDDVTAYLNKVRTSKASQQGKPGGWK